MMDTPPKVAVLRHGRPAFRNFSPAQTFDKAFGIAKQRALPRRGRRSSCARRGWDLLVAGSPTYSGRAQTLLGRSPKSRRSWGPITSKRSASSSITSFTRLPRGSPGRCRPLPAPRSRSELSALPRASARRATPLSSARVLVTAAIRLRVY